MRNNLRVRRAELRVSQLDVALAAGLTHTRLWRIENGYADPRPKEREALARALKTDDSLLFPEDEPSERDSAAVTR